MKEERGWKAKLKKVVNSKFFMLLAAVVILSVIGVIAGDVVINNGNVEVEDSINLTTNNSVIYFPNHCMYEVNSTTFRIAVPCDK